MEPDQADRAHAARWSVLLGVLMLAHLGLIVAVKLDRGLNAELWWLSHISLALAAIGLVLRSHAVRNAALLALIWPHGIWLLDSAIGLMTGQFPLGLTGYLASADAATWVATAHHFYLLPALLVIFACERRFTWESLAVASVTLVVLTVSSRTWLPASANINMSHRLLGNVEAPLIRWTDALNAPAYLALINVWVIVMFFLPAAVLLKRWSASPRHDAIPAGLGTAQAGVG